MIKKNNNNKKNSKCDKTNITEIKMCYINQENIK